MSVRVTHASELELEIESIKRWMRSKPAYRWWGRPVTNYILNLQASIPSTPEKLAKGNSLLPKQAKGWFEDGNPNSCHDSFGEFDNDLSTLHPTLSERQRQGGK